MAKLSKETFAKIFIGFYICISNVSILKLRDRVDIYFQQLRTFFVEIIDGFGNLRNWNNNY